LLGLGLLPRLYLRSGSKLLLTTLDGLLTLLLLSGICSSSQIAWRWHAIR